MPLDLPVAARGSPRLEPAAPPPPPVGWMEGAGASFDAAVGDVPGQDARVRNNRYGELLGPLTDLGYDSGQFLTGGDGMTTGSTFNEDAIYQAVLRERAKGHFNDLPDSKAAFDQQWQKGQNAFLAERGATAAGGPASARFVGGIGGAFLDPVNVATLPVGGVGKNVLLKILTEGIAQAGIEGAELPLVQAQRRQAGRPEMSGREEAMAIALAGGGGVVLRGLGEAVGPTAEAASRSIEKNLNRLPAPLRERWQAATLNGAVKDWDRVFTHDPTLVADIAERLIRAEALTHAERGAIHAVRTDAMHGAANPFAPNGAGAALHDGLMQDTLARVLSEHPAPSPASRAVPGPEAPAPLASGSAEARFKQKVAGAESGGNNFARNPNSSAAGRFQFTDGTWLSYYKRRFGTGGLGDAAILAKKADPRLQNLLMDDMTGDNARFLRVLGEPVSEGNLYLTHFAGQGGARRIFTANPAARLENVVGAEVIKANPFLRGKTAQWLIDWAHARMGEGAAPRGGAGVRFADGFVAGDAERARLQDALDAAQGRAAAAGEAARAGVDAIPEDSARAIAASADAVPARVDGADLLPEAMPERPIEAAASLDVPPHAEAMALLPQLREIVRGPEARSLNDIDKLAGELGASPEDVRRGLTALAQTGELRFVQRQTDRVRVKNAQGQWRTKTPHELVAENGGMWNGGFARRTLHGGPEDLMRFLAKQGGLEPNGLGAAEVARRERSGEVGRDGKVKGHDLRNTGGLATVMVPGKGPLLRPSGLGLDAAIELAHDAGYFGPPSVTPRPTESEFLTLISDLSQTGEKRFSAFDGGGMPEQPAAREDAPPEPNNPPPPDGAPDPKRDWTPEERAASFRTAWAHYGNDLADLPDDPELLRDAARLWTGGEAFLPQVAVVQAVEDNYRAVLADLIDESMEKDYGRAHDIFHPDAVAEWQRRFDRRYANWVEERAGADGARGGGQDGVGSDAGASGESGRADQAGGEAAESGARLAELPPEERTRFLDPEGETAKAQADSLEHDARMAMLDEALPAGASPEHRVVSPAGVNNLGGGAGKKNGVHLPGVRRELMNHARQLGVLNDHYDAILAYQGGEAAFGPIHVYHGDAEALDAELARNPDHMAALARRQAASLTPEGVVEFSLEEGGPAKPLADWLDELDADAAEIKTIRDCLE